MLQVCHCIVKNITQIILSLLPMILLADRAKFNQIVVLEHLLMVRWVVRSISHDNVRSSHCSTTGIPKAVECAILSLG